MNVRLRNPSLNCGLVCGVEEGERATMISHGDRDRSWLLSEVAFGRIWVKNMGFVTFSIV